MKRLLIFLPYVPYPLMRGTYQRVYHLAEALAGHFDVDLFCLSSEPEDASHLARCPQFKVILVGKNPDPGVRAYGSLAGVEFVGEVADVRPFYQKAWLQMVPLRIGGGTRLKIAEGLAMANPVVSTRLGAQGLDLDQDEHLLLADTPEEFAGAMLRYVNDPALRHRHAQAGRARILERYTWGALGSQLAKRLDSLTPPLP